MLQKNYPKKIFTFFEDLLQRIDSGFNVSVAPTSQAHTSVTFLSLLLLMTFHVFVKIGQLVQKLKGGHIETRKNTAS